MSTLTKEKIIDQIEELSKKLGKGFIKEFFKRKSKKELKRILQAFKREVDQRSLIRSNSDFVATARSDRSSGQQRNKDAIAELLRNGRLGSF